MSRPSRRLIDREGRATVERVGLRKRPDGRMDRLQLEKAVHYGFRVVRWHLDGKRGERIER